ncbi:hypothetical protein D3C73_651690 [compost metagenome]
MQALQVGVRLVQGVAVAIARQRRGFFEVVGAHHLVGAVRPQAVFIDVVAQEQGQVRLFVGHVAIGAEIAALPVRAGGDGQAQAVGGGVRGGRGQGAAGRALLALGGEAIPVVAVRGEAGDLDMNAVGRVARGGDVAGGDDAAELVVGGDFPAHGDVGGQAA